jgi:hypothetical protein
LELKEYNNNKKNGEEEISLKKRTLLFFFVSLGKTKKNKNNAVQSIVIYS